MNTKLDCKLRISTSKTEADSKGYDGRKNTRNASNIDRNDHEKLSNRETKVF